MPDSVSGDARFEDGRLNQLDGSRLLTGKPSEASGDFTVMFMTLLDQLMSLSVCDIDQR